MNGLIYASDTRSIARLCHFGFTMVFCFPSSCIIKEQKVLFVLSHATRQKDERERERIKNEVIFYDDWSLLFSLCPMAYQIR